ncbi:MAG: N-acetyl-gamma-glutamyl-phosphate reductase [Acidobacteria bacterium]|nr:N-acetyl-gamma-glutamyl-phosphate reductase [Acidobacteriota bacterium]
MMKTVAIVGASGYAGAELCALLARHSGVELVALYSGPGGESRTFAEVHPSLAGRRGPITKPLNDVEGLARLHPNFVFLATPHESSAAMVPSLCDLGTRVIDLSGAFRLSSSEDYERWYGFVHPAPALLPHAVYGLTEWCDGSLADARLVANPGCYPTCALLALKPIIALLDQGIPVVCDAKSGTSGAGKQADVMFSFTELAGNFKAYNVGTHRHEPEIRRHSGLAGDTPFLFVTHLLPTVRGILSTIYVSFSRVVTSEELAQIYRGAYQDCPFVHIHPPGRLPEMKEVVGTPNAAIGFVVLRDGSCAVIVSVIDNLLKGAASQAVQNFNRMAGFSETEGLR